ncbi:hypothetical protein L7F22_005196 [Adiantum nelumboides]|nr:hypothetical protein [Adiantum nelumboides]
MKWIKRKNKGLSTRELLREFEKRYDQLSATEQHQLSATEQLSIRSKRVALFVQAADARLQKSLEQLLKDASGELSLTSDWKLVPDAINLIVKRQMRVDNLIVADFSETSDEEVKDKSATLKHKLEEPVLDDLVKGIQELNVNLKAIKLDGLSSKGSTSNSRPQSPRRDCMCCDNQDHELRDCDDFNEVYKKNIVFWKDNKIHLRATADDDDAKAYGELWPYTLKMATRGKVSRGNLCEAGNCICETTGWFDPVDSLSLYAYIAKLEANETWVEEKRKRDEETTGSSKRATRSNNKKEEVPKPMPEVSMEDAPKDKKQGKLRGSSYKNLTWSWLQI